ncbi:MAG: LuxR C-terminal-related transcriptional regulator [Coxiellaceae bacterium]|nr:LuxR C-terminal-related transcriptional regulator [Coxiellaceae bacterium]
MRDDIKKQVQQHLGLFDVEDVASIFQPMAKHFNIEYMEFARIFRDGSDINLTTHPEWLDYYYCQQLYNENPLEKEIDNYTEGYVVGSEILKDTNMVQMGIQQIGLFYRFVVVKPNLANGYCDFYYFGAKQGNHYFELNCMNNIDLIEHFINHFNYYAADMVSALDKRRICVPGRFDSNSAEIDKLNICQKKVDRMQFLSELNKGGAIIRSNNQLIKLTKREAELSGFIVSGMSMREIAGRCSVSPRTIETHLVHIKQKLQADSKSDLIQKLRTARFSAA